MLELTHSPTARSPIRVLHLVPQLRVGGMERGLVNLVNGLAAGPVASSICSFDARFDSLRETIDPRVAVSSIGRRAGNDPRLVWRLSRLLRHQRPHIVHAHTWGTLCEGYLAARIGGIASFVHGEHGTMELRQRNRLVQRWIWKRADCVLAVSSRLADRMAREVGFPRQRVRVVRTGTDLTRYGAIPRESARRALDLPDGAFVIGTVGRLVPVKDHDTFLATLLRLGNAGLDCVALVAGEGPRREELEARGRAVGLGSRVRFLGNRGDVDRVLAALDVFLLTSVSEGLPNSVLEAMASGLPVVATDVGGLQELVDHGVTGLLAPTKDAGALAAAVSALASDPARRQRMGAAGRSKAQSEFGLRRMLDEYERLYLELAGRRAATSSGLPLDKTATPCAESLAG
jgi:sugar transferase (PEP-CTERM/EpsH1 system associated)